MAGRATQPLAVSQPPGGGGGHQHHPYPHPVAAEGEGPEEEAEAFELRPRGREKVRRSASRDRPDDIVLLTRDIQEGDTLNAIALQFCCSVADIKRVNNLINDQDFFALRSIKIPVKKFSVLTETHASPKGRPVLRPAHCSPEVLETSPSDKFSANETAGNFLKEVDRDIEEIVKCNDTKRENLNEVVSALAAQQAGEMFCQEKSEKGEVQSPAPVEEQAQAQGQVGKQLCRKGPGVLLDNKLNVS
ncbi:lysM and putative peptidoglycan-binding domain-containing protein 3 isoform X2 [Cygnus olor]|uniref:lysM and putative peptidoglycan-binding domain-containing protein 3 isoform X2 n=1 Tax=Cygnus olor TaxID=8869 RepID=UPI001ADE8855|nr:lysM and putative peptidoglycan-binding domain-containing protein 3 isoform X2 [Cygnus olor]